MRLRYIYHGRGKMEHPFYVKTNREPPVQRSVTLEKYLEETIKLSEIEITKPKPNMPKSEREAVRQLKETQKQISRRQTKEPTLS